MTQIAVISGKGGTGKTTIAAIWATLTRDAMLVDADVDASNLGLALQGEELERHRHFGKEVAVVNTVLCTSCGICGDLCRFGAIDTSGDYPLIDEHVCEGCRLCSVACPNEAITMENRVTGHWYLSRSQYGEAVHADMNVGEGNTGSLVTEIRRAAERRAVEAGLGVILIDGPPGIGCKTISAIAGVDLAVVVTEPSVAAHHDLDRALAVCARLEVGSCVILNKVGLTESSDERLRATLEERGAELLGELPFIGALPQLLSSGALLTATPSAIQDKLRSMWNRAVAIAQSAM